MCISHSRTTVGTALSSAKCTFRRRAAPAAGRLCGRFRHDPAPNHPTSPTGLTTRLHTRVIITIRAHGPSLPEGYSAGGGAGGGTRTVARGEEGSLPPGNARRRSPNNLPRRNSPQVQSTPLIPPFPGCGSRRERSTCRIRLTPPAPGARIPDPRVPGRRAERPPPGERAPGRSRWRGRGCGWR